MSSSQTAAALFPKDAARVARGAEEGELGTVLSGVLACNTHALFLGRVLAEYCPKLRSLKVKHCHNVAESSLSVLRSRGVELDVEPLPQTALVLLQDMAGFAPFINLQI